jgi:hypothetical protein
VDGLAVQVSLIFHLNGDHWCSLEGWLEKGVCRRCAHPLSYRSHG